MGDQWQSLEQHMGWKQSLRGSVDCALHMWKRRGIAPGGTWTSDPNTAQSTTTHTVSVHMCNSKLKNFCDSWQYITILLNFITSNFLLSWLFHDAVSIALYYWLMELICKQQIKCRQSLKFVDFTGFLSND